MRNIGIALIILLSILAVSCSYGRVNGHDAGREKEVYLPVDKPPRLVLIRDAGVYYAPESRSDIFFYGGWWYYYSDSTWYRSVSYKGLWKGVEEGSLPFAILKVPLEDFKVPPPDWVRKEGEENRPTRGNGGKEEGRPPGD